MLVTWSSPALLAPCSDGNSDGGSLVGARYHLLEMRCEGLQSFGAASRFERFFLGQLAGLGGNVFDNIDRHVLGALCQGATFSDFLSGVSVAGAEHVINWMRWMAPAHDIAMSG